MRSATPVELAAIVRNKGIRDLRVLAALEQVPRAGFVPSDRVADAYLDRPLPIPHEQVTTQPSLLAVMVEALGLTGNERVLEVGTGLGFQSAVLARLAAFVWSVERWKDLAEAARENLARAGVENVEVVVGDGSEGLPEHAPYDAILVSAAFPSVRHHSPPSWPTDARWSSQSVRAATRTCSCSRDDLARSCGAAP